MTSDEIELLTDKLRYHKTISGQKVYFEREGEFLECHAVIPEWYERYYDGTVASIAEPAVKVSGGRYIALDNCTLEDFVVVQKLV